MLSNGIETRPFFGLFTYKMHYLKNIEKDESLPNSEKIGKKWVIYTNRSSYQ